LAVTTTAIDVTGVQPFSHEEAMALQELELDRALVFLRSLDEAGWNARTDCPDWDVRAIYQHVLGACEAGASVRENLHQLRRARAHRRKHGGPLEAALSATQVRERASLSPARLVARLADVAPRTVRGRTRTPAIARNRIRLAVDGPVHEKWTLGYLIDTVYLRDLWMHRVDAYRAVQRPLELDAGHDGRIVAEIVAEWARRHGKPFDLRLSGDAGGHYAHRLPNDGSEVLSLDAVEFCRTLAGRCHASGLLSTVVPF
jgi:uncharacterized protein (TIGR03083 family)